MGLIPISAASLLAVIFFISFLKERKTRIHLQKPAIPDRGKFYKLSGYKPVACSFNEWVISGKSRELNREEPFLDSVVSLRFLGISKGLSKNELPLLFEVMFYFGDLRTRVMLADNYESALKGFSYAVVNAEKIIQGMPVKTIDDNNS